jgi:hypothetical protein
LVEKARQLCEKIAQIAAIQQIRNRTEQISEKIARSRYRCDVEDYLIQVHGESQQIQVQRPKIQGQYGTTPSDAGERYVADNLACHCTG